VSAIQATAGGVLIQVRVIPRASRAALAGTRDGAILVRLTAPPVEGAANDELVALLAEILDVPRRAVTIVAGARSRSKRLKVSGVTLIHAAGRLPH
jgi:uncharacterized protein (TIGR00251 family)